jgi:hypothetical protein
LKEFRTTGNLEIANALKKIPREDDVWEMFAGWWTI